MEYPKSTVTLSEACELFDLDDSDDEENQPFEEQIFKHDKKTIARRVEVTSIIQPNKMILELVGETVRKKMDFYLVLNPVFYTFRGLPELIKKTTFRTKMHVVANTCKYDWDNDENDEDNFDGIMAAANHAEFQRGLILRDTSVDDKGQTFSVFLYDVGKIQEFTEFELAPLPPKDCKIEEFPPMFILMQIPGLVPRAEETELEKLIHKGKNYNRQARTWSKVARTTVENWLEAQKKVYFRCLLAVQDKCLFFGDLYGSTSAGDVSESSVSKCLLETRSAFVSPTFLKQICTEEGAMIQ